jgi:glycosyltransferase involved in cell wall biosynthesis
MNLQTKRGEKLTDANLARDLTIVVPAYNEEKHISTTLDVVTRAANRNLDNYEIIVVNDGSSDATGQMAEEAAKKDQHIRVHHQPTNQGVGAAYMVGLGQARYPSISLVCGDNAFSEAALDNVWGAIGSAPLVISYRSNLQVRKPLRRFLSVGCTACMRVITGAKIRDAQSMFIWPVELARECAPRSSGYGYHIETLGRMLTLCRTIHQVPAPLNPAPDDNSRVMRPQVLISQGLTMLSLAFWRFIIYPVSGRHW